MAGVGIVAVAVVAFSGLSCSPQNCRTGAKGEYESLKPQVAIETLMQARTFMPFNSSLYQDAGHIQLELSQKRRDPQYLAAAIESFRRSIELSPNRVDSHLDLGLCLSASHDVAGGLKEIRVAQIALPRQHLRPDHCPPHGEEPGRDSVEKCAYSASRSYKRLISPLFRDNGLR